MALNVPDLHDEVVTLRLPDERDVDAITDACQDPEIPRFTRVASPYGRDDALEYVGRTASGWRDGTSAGFVIADAADDTVLGSIGVMRFDDTRAVAEVGYWVARAARGHGLASRSVRLASRWALRELGISRLELMTRVENVASQGVAERAGFTREGVLRSYMTHGCGLADVVMFSLIPSDLPN
jgi:RimJ/RimL family protein N-acetyltransferase